MIGRLVAWIVVCGFVQMFAGGVSAGPESGPSCKAVAFPHSRTKSRESLERIFEKSPRQNLVQYFFYEITKPRSPSVAKALSSYLIDTEFNPETRDFFEAVSGHADVAWNVTPQAQSLTEICSLYHRAGGGARGPASSRTHAQTGAKGYPVYFEKP